MVLDVLCDRFRNEKLLTVKLLCHLALIVLLEKNVKGNDKRNDKERKNEQKDICFHLLPECLLKRFLYMPVMGPFPIDLCTGTTLQESFMCMIDVVRNAFFDILSFVNVFKLTVTLCAAAPQGFIDTAKQLLHLRKLIDNTISGDEYTITYCLSPCNTGIPRNDRPLLFLSTPDELPVVHVPVIKDIMTKQPQPCCKSS
jgi:hypothetical protein